MSETNETQLLEEEVNRLRRRVAELESRDITERKQAGQQVKRLQKLSELSVTLAGDPIDVFRRVAAMIGQLLDVRVVCLSEVRGDELHFTGLARTLVNLGCLGCLAL